MFMRAVHTGLGWWVLQPCLLASLQIDDVGFDLRVSSNEESLVDWELHHAFFSTAVFHEVQIKLFDVREGQRNYGG